VHYKSQWNIGALQKSVEHRCITKVSENKHKLLKKTLEQL